MIAIIPMRMVMQPAVPVIDQVCRDYEEYGRHQEPQLVLVKDLFQHQQGESKKEKKKGEQGMVVFFIPVVKRIGPDQKGQHDHACLKAHIVNDVQAKQGKAAEEKRQQGTMDRTGQ